MSKTSIFHPGVIFALVTAIGLGAITTQAKFVFADGGNAMTLMFMRFLISPVIFVSCIVILRKPLAIPKAHRLQTLLLGIIWSAAMMFYMTSVETISVSLAVLILYAYPVIVLVVSIVTRQLLPSLLLTVLFVSAFAGLYLALSGSEIKIDGQGLLFAGLASIGAAYTFIIGAKVASQFDPLVLTFWINLTGLVMILPLLPGQFQLPQTTTGFFALGLATIFYIIAILCQFQALARLKAATAAFLLNLEPVVSILLAVFFLNETLQGAQWLGVGLVISSIAFLSLLKNR
jgi:drug/metabolite transporter (DMT)-like permease